MSRKIKHISFLYKDERIVVNSNLMGKFKIPVTNGNKTKYKYFSAKELLELEEIKSGDPSLTLEDGDKIRVFQGGDPSYLPALVDGVITAHDSLFVGKPKIRKSSITKPAPPQYQEQSYFDWYDNDDGF